MYVNRISRIIRIKKNKSKMLIRSEDNFNLVIVLFVRTYEYKKIDFSFISTHLVVLNDTVKFV